MPNFGDPEAELLIVGLAPAAHGANRTGRMFTGDRSGDFLYAALHEAGMANQGHATDRDDGLGLRGVAITAAAHCAPPSNRPTREELENCFAHLTATVRALSELRGLVALGGIAHRRCLELYRAMGWADPRPLPRFGHGEVFRPDGAPFLIDSYHPSQQNTFTGRLTRPMLIDVLRTAKRLAAGSVR